MWFGGAASNVPSGEPQGRFGAQRWSLRWPVGGLENTAMRDDPHHTDPIHTTSTAVDPELLASQLWDQIQDLFVDWANAERMDEGVRAARIEQEFRFFALAYASAPVDVDAVSTGRKAVVRSIYARLGTIDTINVLAMLDAVIRREDAAARREA